MAAQGTSRASGADGAGPDGARAAAFTEVFREHHLACLRLARRMVHDESTAHDVVQDVFLSWWRSDGGGYRADRGELGPWLSTLTHHKSVDAVRADERRRRLLHASSAAVGEVEHLPDDVVWWELGRQALVLALPRLSDKHREVLSLAYAGGLTQVEIAAHLDIPLGTVKSRTSAGLLRLRAAMSGTWTPTGPAAEPAALPDPGPAPALLAAARPATTDPATLAARGCAVELTRLAAAGADDRAGAAIAERARLLAAEHGEAALLALVVALARAASSAGPGRDEPTIGLEPTAVAASSTGVVLAVRG